MAELILALDVPSSGEAMVLLDRLRGVRWVKVGSVLMTAEGPDLVSALRKRGLSVFLDLKWHDIPNTVHDAVAAARRLGVAMATVHTLGGSEMMAAAADAAGPEVGLVGVTVLTSHTPESYGAATGRGATDLGEEVVRQARRAREAGLRGVVASAREAAALRRELGPDAWLVVPGIRPAGSDAGDQARTATPAAAVQAGASHLVVGRPVLRAADPAAAWTELVKETAA